MHIFRTGFLAMAAFAFWYSCIIFCSVGTALPIPDIHKTLEFISQLPFTYFALSPAVVATFFMFLLLQRKYNFLGIFRQNLRVELGVCVFGVGLNCSMHMVNRLSCPGTGPWSGVLGWLPSCPTACATFISAFVPFWHFCFLWSWILVPCRSFVPFYFVVFFVYCCVFVGGCCIVAFSFIWCCSVQQNRRNILLLQQEMTSICC